MNRQPDTTLAKPPNCPVIGVHLWKNSSHRHRWLGTALVDIEPRLRKVVGYRHLFKLREALKRELEIDTKTSKRKAA